MHKILNNKLSKLVLSRKLAWSAAGTQWYFLKSKDRR